MSLLHYIDLGKLPETGMLENRNLFLFSNVNYVYSLQAGGGKITSWCF